ncbi:IclR family transcriptional regulator [Brevibacillus nitrificans]|uniref:IclR family transcriptional regulator n=1 Tax=Brevibacillus nitrificans TaxID=651560 RepID=UPI002860B0F3|nr:IclR family transcriptional regulator [Brevibacillus nitrificans]MDR7313793.1 DNA-binding IclR family transcriptional regulator [Brevibacillus nitrificans]
MIQNKNKTVVKSMELLNLFIEHSRLSLNEMVELSGIPKTSIHRMVGSLEGMDFLQKGEDGRYSLGLLFLQFGQLVAERLDIRQIALPAMTKLRDQVEEAVNLIIRDGKEAIYIEKLDTNHPVRLYTKIGRRSPLYAGACSRIILSYIEEKERERYLQETELIPIGHGTITDKERLRQELELAREKGYTISCSELENDTVSIAAPIFDHTGRLVAGISIAGPQVRFEKERIPDLIGHLLKTSEEISRELGWRGAN